MNILVTGGAGFIGTNLIRHYISNGYHGEHNIYSLDDYSTGREENEVYKGCTYHRGDISNIHNITEDVDIVFHLAAKARIQPSFESPEDYINTNFQGTYEVVKYCMKRGIPLIYAGSSSKHSGRYKNPYTFSKDLGEDIIKLYQKHYGLKASIARFYNVYGPHQLFEGGYTTIIGRWFNNICLRKPCVIYGDGEQRRDFTYVGDIISALVSIEEQKAYGYEFELGRGKNYSINELAAMLDITPVYEPEKKGEARETLCDISFAKEVLGWVPRSDLPEYIHSFKVFSRTLI